MIYNIYTVSIPAIDTGTVHFSFTSEVEGRSFVFDFWYYSERWNVFVILPDGAIREAVLYPNAQNWTGFTDYRLIAMTDRTSIGLDDLQLISLKLAVLE